jgi:hypothetical protein
MTLCVYEMTFGQKKVVRGVMAAVVLELEACKTEMTLCVY